ncbi:TRAP transporter small permease [Aminobacter sp. MDW-2]|uniref:TRAP transporter small permease n=1 Tax=Aminobacter sp. MDW-2 TaxID=2666139 RepID=UPI00163CF4D8|nr:TRAP transporter small permease [Aminobacter sp. MDW-2]QNH37893.1 TRAP transporter small permease [Aminobacter sp. MDW-2]
MQKISRLTDGLNLVVSWIVGLFLAISSAAVFAQVLIRFVLPSFGIIVAAPWTEEISRYLIIWVVFLGVAVLCRNFRLIAVEILALMVPRPIGNAFKFFSIAVSLCFFALTASIGLSWTQMSAIELSPVMRFPMNWVYFAMPVGSLLAIFNLLVLAAEAMTGQRDLLEAHPDAED